MLVKVLATAAIGAAVANASQGISTTGVSLVKTTANNDGVTIADAAATNIGQMKTVIYVSADNQATDNLLVKNAAAQTLATLGDAGDVALLMWSGASWLVVGQSS